MESLIKILPLIYVLHVYIHLVWRELQREIIFWVKNVFEHLVKVVTDQHPKIIQNG